MFPSPNYYHFFFLLNPLPAALLHVPLRRNVATGETRGDEQPRPCAQDLIKSPRIQLLLLSLSFICEIMTEHGHIRAIVPPQVLYLSKEAVEVSVVRLTVKVTARQQHEAVFSREGKDVEVLERNNRFFIKDETSSDCTCVNH